jgi:hypothetical protein
LHAPTSTHAHQHSHARTHAHIRVCAQNRHLVSRTPACPSWIAGQRLSAPRRAAGRRQRVRTAKGAAAARGGARRRRGPAWLLHSATSAHNSCSLRVGSVAREPASRRRSGACGRGRAGGARARGARSTARDGGGPRRHGGGGGGAARGGMRLAARVHQAGEPLRSRYLGIMRLEAERAVVGTGPAPGLPASAILRRPDIAGARRHGGQRERGRGAAQRGARARAGHPRVGPLPQPGAPHAALCRAHAPDGIACHRPRVLAPHRCRKRKRQGQRQRALTRGARAAVRCRPSPTAAQALEGERAAAAAAAEQQRTCTSLVGAAHPNRRYSRGRLRVSVAP